MTSSRLTFKCKPRGSNLLKGQNKCHFWILHVRKHIFTLCHFLDSEVRKVWPALMFYSRVLGLLVRELSIWVISLPPRLLSIFLEMTPTGSRAVPFLLSFRGWTFLWFIRRISWSKCPVIYSSCWLVKTTLWAQNDLRSRRALKP